METDWGTNVGTLLGGILAGSVLASTTIAAGDALGLPSIVSTPIAVIAAAVGFFGVMYLFYRGYLDDEPEPETGTR